MSKIDTNYKEKIHLPSGSENNIPQESPYYLRLSLASAMTLGFAKGLFYRNAKNYCLNLLLSYSQGCRANCSYCGLARERQGQYEKKSFIRVTWPLLPTTEVISAIQQNISKIRRICISMITIPQAQDDALIILSQLKEKIPELPVSILISPTLLSDSALALFHKAGADRIGVAIDAASEKIFAQHRGKQRQAPHQWSQFWETAYKAADIFGPEKVGIHLMVGLGETEKQMLQTIQKVRNFCSGTHLFSFYPEAQSDLENWSPPLLSQYRRIQLGRFLIDEQIAHFDLMNFDAQDRLIDFGVSQEILEDVINSGKPFVTSGCPSSDGQMACNRPFANELPGSDLRNFPFLPEVEDLKGIKESIFNY